jgi:hypothetical protein
MPIKAAPLTKRTKFTAAVNPQRRKRKPRKVSGAPRRKNPGATVLLGYLNPEKRPMTKTKKHKKIRRPKKNPFFAMKKRAKRSHRPRRRNPSNILSISRPIELLKAGAFGAIAYFATRQVPQMVLKARNVGWIGYLANLATALTCASAAGKYFGPAAGQSAFVGGGMYLFGRVLNDQTPYGARLALSGIGDPSASSHGLRGMVPGTFLSPMTVTRSGQPVYPPSLTQHIQSQIPAPPARAAAGVSGGRFAARF